MASGNAKEFHDAAKSAHVSLAGHSDALRALLAEYMTYGGRPGVAVKDDAGEKADMLDGHL